MVGHETVGPHLDPGLARLFGQQISINLLVAVLKKDRLPTIPTLRNVMRKASNYRTRQIVPWGKLTRMKEPGIGVPLSPQGEQDLTPRQSDQSVIVGVRTDPEPGDERSFEEAESAVS